MTGQHAHRDRGAALHVTPDGKDNAQITGQSLLFVSQTQQLTADCLRACM